MVEGEEEKPSAASTLRLPVPLAGATVVMARSPPRALHGSSEATPRCCCHLRRRCSRRGEGRCESAAARVGRLSGRATRGRAVSMTIIFLHDA
jgi:hypothetical protein